MNHQWRPRSIQGNICPICSTSHFPFCPALPNPGYPLGAPNFNPQISMQRTMYPNMVERYHDPPYLNGNPNLPIDTFHNQYQFRPTYLGDPGSSNLSAIYPQQIFNHGGNPTRNEYNNVDFRSTKRLRVDEPNPASYASEVDGNSARALPDENERRLKLIRDHGNTGDVRQDGSYGGISGNKFQNDASQYRQAANSRICYHGYQPRPYPTNDFLGEKSYHGLQHSVPEYDVHANLPVEKGSPYDPPAKASASGHMDHMRYGNQGRQAFQNYSVGPHYGRPDMEKQGDYNNSIQRGFNIRPPLPSSPPPPLPPNPPLSSAPSRASPSLFPIQDSTSAPLHTSYHRASGAPSLGQQSQKSAQSIHDSRCLFPPNSPGTLASGAGQPFMTGRNCSDTPKVIDISHLFKQPHRATRPDHFVIILRGLPGSGKSYLAKMLRDLEVEHGGSAPRIHSMDDYFMTEVEKVEDNEASKPSRRGQRAVIKMVLEYCYEPEMEEAYRSSMLKAFKKTLEEGAFTFVIVDDRNLRVADFAQFWATAKRLGYEVYLLEAPYKDPAGCTARNVHNFTKGDIEKMARQWEDAPSLYLQVDPKSLFRGDDLKEGNIEEVDMDMEEDDVGKGSSELDEKKPEKLNVTVAVKHGPDGLSNDEKKWEGEVDNPPEEVKDLGHSKWSSTVGDGDDDNDTETEKRKQNSLFGLHKAYEKEGKSVHWGDQVANVGFSIGAVKRANSTSLIIGPGAGYNLKSNPLSDDVARSSIAQETKKRTVFQDRLRAERESFRAVFDRRKHRIGGFGDEDE